MPAKQQKINNKGTMNNSELLEKMLGLIKEKEGFEKLPKLDPSDIPSAGHGFAYGYIAKDGTRKKYSKEYINKNFFPEDLVGKNKGLDSEDDKNLDKAFKAINDAHSPKVREEEKNHKLRQAQEYLNQVKAQIDKTHAGKIAKKILKRDATNLEELSTQKGIDLTQLITPTRMAIIDNSYRFGPNDFLSNGKRSTQALQESPPNEGKFILEIVALSNKQQQKGVDIRNYENGKRIWDATSLQGRKLRVQQMKEHFSTLSEYDKASAAQFFERIQKFDQRKGQPRPDENFMNYKEYIPPGPWREPHFQKEGQNPPPLGEKEGSLLNHGTQYANVESANGGTEQVRAHTREGYHVRAYTRKA